MDLLELGPLLHKPVRQLSLGERMKVEFAAGIQQAAQYRIQYTLYVLFSVIRPIIFLAAWAAVATAQGGRVGDFTAADFAGYYIALTIVIHLTTAWNSLEFELEVRQGRFSPKLLRPLHPLHYSVVENIIWKVTTVPPLVAVLALIAWTFGARFGTTPLHLVLFVPSIVLAAALRFLAGWCVASLAFWFTRIQTANTLFERTAFIFAGSIAPISLLPSALQAAAYVLPFGYMLFVPAEILRGGVTVEVAVLLIGGQLLWLAATFALFRMVWRAGVRTYSSVGA